MHTLLESFISFHSFDDIIDLKNRERESIRISYTNQTYAKKCTIWQNKNCKKMRDLAKSRLGKIMRDLAKSRLGKKMRDLAKKCKKMRDVERGNSAKIELQCYADFQDFHSRQPTILIVFFKSFYAVKIDF